MHFDSRSDETFGGIAFLVLIVAFAIAYIIVTVLT